MYSVLDDLCFSVLAWEVSLRISLLLGWEIKVLTGKIPSLACFWKHFNFPGNYPANYGSSLLLLAPEIQRYNNSA